jgi:hypothetical protein
MKGKVDTKGGGTRLFLQSDAESRNVSTIQLCMHNIHYIPLTHKAITLLCNNLHRKHRAICQMSRFEIHKRSFNLHYSVQSALFHDNQSPVALAGLRLSKSL